MTNYSKNLTINGSLHNIYKIGVKNKTVKIVCHVLPIVNQ